jgi:hypothetical protein
MHPVRNASFLRTLPIGRIEHGWSRVSEEWDAGFNDG